MRRRGARRRAVPGLSHPSPSTIAAAPEFVRADAADRQKDLAFYEKRVEEIRLRELADEREEGR